MANPSRGSNQKRGRYPSHSRGGARGRPSNYGRGQKPRRRGGEKPTFNPSRVEEQADKISNESEEACLTEDNLESVSSQLNSDEEDIEAARSHIKPYKVLLQSLITSNRGEQPERKKRKLSQITDPKDLATLKKDIDLMADYEDPTNLEIDELIDPEESNEIREGHDPYIIRLENTDEIKLSQMIEDVENNKWLTTKIAIDSAWSFSLKAPSIALSSKAKSLQSTEDIFLKQKLKKSAAKLLPRFDQLIGHVASAVFAYQDFLFPHRDLGNAEILRKIVTLHSLNHVFKTRDKVIKNNARVAGGKEGENIEIRDQGFTRPKVLVILPTRQSCLKYVDTIIDLVEPEQQENKKRFQDSYMQGADDFSHNKPEDFKELFGGNNDDLFRLGMKFTRKTIKYFTQFYNSDIILASPLGLRMALGDEKSKEDYDFLSSIEIVILDQTEALAMQNWDHIEYIFEHLNLQPKQAHDCDFSRVRNWYLENNAKYLRQTLLISAFNFPSLNGIYTHHMLNVSGKSKYHRAYEGAMLGLGIQVKQTFSRYDVSSLITDPDDRFAYFSSAVLPSLTKYSKEKSRSKEGVLIYLPSYADFVRVRNYLATASNAQSISFGSISEYTSVKDVARARSHFSSGRHTILLYTERAHHFRRYHIKGVKSIIMYGLPDNPLFYKEIVGGYLESSVAQAAIDVGQVNVRSLYSKLDVLKLERIVGSKRYMSLLRDSGSDTFDFI